MRSGHCWESAGRRWLRRMTGCTPVHGNIQNATAKAWRASSELGYRQNRHQIWCSWVSTGQAWMSLCPSFLYISTKSNNFFMAVTSLSEFHLSTISMYIDDNLAFDAS